MTFRERFLAGQADFDELFDLTEEWNFSDDPRTLREYLGLTGTEEDIWISESDEALETFMTKEKNRKIFFTDLDGTLLDDRKELSSENREALNALLQEGHIVAITTGRALSSAMAQAKKLGLYGKNCYLICYNGGEIFDSEQEKVIFRAEIPTETVRFIFDEADKFGISIQTYTETAVLAEKDSEDLKKYIAIQKIDYHIVEDVTKALDQLPPKILALDYAQNERIKAFRDYIAPLCEGKLDVFLSNPALLELVPAGINKGFAVRFLCEYLAIPISNTVSAGDAENDLSMILSAQVGAAMCNGETLLKDNADYITMSDNNHSGVAEIIQKFVLSETKAK